MSTTQKVKIALIGCGGIAQAHWRGIQGHAPHIAVAAVVDTDGERAQKMAELTGAKCWKRGRTIRSASCARRWPFIARPRRSSGKKCGTKFFTG